MPLHAGLRADKLAARRRAVADPKPMNDYDLATDPLLDADARFDRYRILERIGAGGFGSVYLAHDPKHDRQVALKILRLDEYDDDPVDTQARFLREIKISAKVRSPHVARLYGAGVHNERPYMVMEYIDGNALDALIDQAGHINLETAIRIGLGMAEGMLSIHSQRLVHRDIKPANVLVGFDGQVKLIDLGMARIFQSLDGAASTQLTMAGTLMGSPDYISPEAAEDAHRAGPKSDCYSFAASMFLLFTGRTVFAHDQHLKVIYAHLKEPPPSLGEFLPTAHKRLIHIIDACLRKDPHTRPTALQIVDVFKHLYISS